MTEQQRNKLIDQDLYTKLSKWFELRDKCVKAQVEYRELCNEINAALTKQNVGLWVPLSVYSEQEGADIEYYNVMSDDQGRIKVF